ncbi:MAG: hypothetical protein AAB823_00730 [Patescibacteria group bacterium]
MSASDPQVLFMVLVLPSLFGLTLVGEGLNKVMQSERAGWVSIIFGVIFIAVVMVAYVMISGIAK